MASKLYNQEMFGSDSLNLMGMFEREVCEKIEFSLCMQIGYFMLFDKLARGVAVRLAE